MADNKTGLTLPGIRGKQGVLSSLKKFTAAATANIKKNSECKLEFNEGSFRKTDKEGVKGHKKKLRKMEANTIMQATKQTEQPPTGKVTDYIKKFDSKNSSGAIKHHLETLDKLLKKGDSKTASLTGMLGSGLMSQIQQSINEQKQQTCPPGQRWDETKQKCVLDCPQGQIWDEAFQRCVIDEGKYDPDIQDGVINILVVSV